VKDLKNLGEAPSMEESMTRKERDAAEEQRRKVAH
jgi:hypothetical protein